MRPNNADEKMIAAIERGDQGEFKDRKPVKSKDKKLIKVKEARVKKALCACVCMCACVVG